jgi:hypothetical protein
MRSRHRSQPGGGFLLPLSGSRAPQRNHCCFNIACHAAKVSGQSIKKLALLFIGRKFTDDGAILGVRKQLFERCL